MKQLLPILHTTVDSKRGNWMLDTCRRAYKPVFALDCISHRTQYIACPNVHGDGHALIRMQRVLAL
jgi:hypothetical protein